MFKSRFFTVGALLLIAFLSLSLIRLRQPISSLNAEIEHVNQKLDDANAKNKDLSSAADNADNGAYLERQLRLKLNYKKADEEAVLIYKIQPTVQQTENTNFFVKEYHKFSDWLKNLF